jgi:hypothetical protein
MSVLEIENTSLAREISAITSSTAKPVHFTWLAKIHVGGMLYEPLKIISIDILQEYELNYADEIILTMTIPGGMYAVDIYPFKDKIDITLIRKPIGEVSTDINLEGMVHTERYTATLIDTGNPVIEGNGQNTPTKDSLNLTSIVTVSFQLVNKAIEQIRMISVGGTYRNATAAQVIRAIMTSEMKKIKVPGVRLPLGVDLASGFNPKIRDHTVIPHGTKLIDVPSYIHKNCGGIYSAGFNYYLQGDFWYVYPCYDPTRFNVAPRTINVINVPRNKYPGIERTYRKDGKNIVIMATGEVKYADNSESQELTFGNGVRFADANNFMTGFSFTKDNKTIVSRGANNTEIVTSHRANGNNNIVLSNNPITANPYYEYSKLARRQGNMLTFVWENSEPSLITPGCLVKFSYINNNKLSTIYGVVLKAHHYSAIMGEGMLGSRYNNQSVIVIFTKQVKS